MSLATIISMMRNQSAPVTPIAPTVHASAQAAGSNTVTTSGIDTTGSSLLVIAVSWYRGGTPGNLPSVSDSKGNTWTALTRSDVGSSTWFSTQMWYCLNPSVGSGHTFTASHGSAIYPSIFASGFSGVKTSGGFDKQSVAGVLSGGTVQPGSVTPAEDNSLLITSCLHVANLAATIDSSFTRIEEQHAASGLSCGALAYKVQTAKSAENPTWTASSYMAAAIAVFKHA